MKRATCTLPQEVGRIASAPFGGSAVRLLQSLRENGLFLSAFPCLSRACLGKMSIFRYKWLKKTVFLPVAAGEQHRGVPIALVDDTQGCAATTWQSDVDALGPMQAIAGRRHAEAPVLAVDGVEHRHVHHLRRRRRLLLLLPLLLTAAGAAAGLSRCQRHCRDYWVLVVC